MDDMLLKCSQCGAELPADSLFCSECGTKVQQPQAQVQPQMQAPQTAQQPQPQVQPQAWVQPQQAQPQAPQTAQQPQQQAQQYPPFQQGGAQQGQFAHNQYQQNQYQPNQYNQNQYQPKQFEQGQYQQGASQNWQQAQQQYGQQGYQQPYGQQPQQPYGQPNYYQQYPSASRKKGSAGGVIGIIIVFALVFAASYYGYSKLVKKQATPLDGIVAAVFGNAEMNKLTQDNIIGSWQGIITFKSYKGLEENNELDAETKEQMKNTLDLPMKLLLTFAKDSSNGYVCEGVITHPQFGDSKIDRMTYTVEMGKVNMVANESDANVLFIGSLTKKDNALLMDGSFSVTGIGGLKQSIEGVWEVNQTSSVPVE